MKTLHIYPTSRALRRLNLQHKQYSGLLPSLMRMDEFEQRAILIENKIKIDPLQRILLLRESAKFEAFESLKVDIRLVRFFTKSDALFKFFEELSAEQVSFEQLAQADAYVEFTTHLEILERLLSNYQKLLEKKGFIDKAFIPQNYQLNHGFLEAYPRIEIHLEGYLSHFEIGLLCEIASQTEVILHYTTSKFNLKMQERFAHLGIILPNHSYVRFSLTSKTLLWSEPNSAKIEATVLCVEERQEQIAVAFVEIEKMIESGLSPHEIVLILPDESLKEHFSLFDRHNNLNFAMGYDYDKGYLYKSLNALYLYWQTKEKEQKALLERYGFKLEKVEAISPTQKCKTVSFFETLDSLGLLDVPLHPEEKKEKFNERVYEAYLHFNTIFSGDELGRKEWLFLWLKTLSKITLDDVRGGMVTVMGVLETRGVAFEGVVIVDFNEGIVPASSSKDQFLNSSVRAFANLPTKHDREALQKQYYKRLLEQASQTTIIYSTSDNKLPSKFLYELGLQSATPLASQTNLLYAEPSQFVSKIDPIVTEFNAFDVVWSAHRLKSYLECKRKYYYRYIQKIQAKKEDELNEGSFLHSLLDHLYRENNHYTTKEEIEKNITLLLDKLLPFETSDIAYKKLLWQKKLQGFMEAQREHFALGWRVIERESEFQGEIGGLRFKGRIDRIDQNGTETLVIDYKSGSTKEANKTKNIETLTDLQMSIYAQILKERYSTLNLAFLKIFEKGKLEEITMLEEKNHHLEQTIIELKQTQSFSAKKCDNLQTCTYCEFTLMCERGKYL